MIDIKLIRNDFKKVEEALNKRGIVVPLDSIIQRDKERREFLVKVEELKKKRNEVSEQVGRLKRGGKKKEAEKLIKEMDGVADKIKDFDTKVKALESDIESELLNVPNIPLESVPQGDSAQDNVVEREWGDKKEFRFEALPHWELGEMLGILDFNLASRLSGTRFAFLKGQGALLERALINFMLDVHTKDGKYHEVLPPFMVSSKTMTGTGQLPKFEVELYKSSNDDLYMIPTAEVPLTNIYRDQVIPEENLPIYYVAYTPCFRREAGSYGKDTKGLIRNHQFNKVELVKFVKPETADKELETLVNDAERVLQLLEIPYRVTQLCTGDLGFAAAKTYDLEIWMPGEKRWREISSCSNFTDYQARRMNIKYRGKDEGLRLVYTLNGSGVAIGRTFAAIIENFQCKDGTVDIPKRLQPYMGGLKKLSH